MDNNNNEKITKFNTYGTFGTLNEDYDKNCNFYY